MSKVKTPITVRVDPELLARVRDSAARDNRSVTNFIETALRRQLDVKAPDSDARAHQINRGSR